MKKEKRIYSRTKQKVLLLLLGGLALGLKKHTPSGQIKIIKQVARGWEAIDRQYLYRCVKEFYSDRLVEYREGDDGTISVVLSEKGRRKTLEFNFDQLEIPKPTTWDGKWRIVIYDIPEKLKLGRESLREKLRGLGFHEWQKSVFIFPYPCRDQIDFVVEVFDLRRYVRYAELTNPTNEEELKLHFGLK